MRVVSLCQEAFIASFISRYGLGWAFIFSLRVCSEGINAVWSIGLIAEAVNVRLDVSMGPWLCDLRGCNRLTLERGVVSATCRWRLADEIASLTSRCRPTAAPSVEVFCEARGEVVWALLALLPNGLPAAAIVGALAATANLLCISNCRRRSFNDSISAWIADSSSCCRAIDCDTPDADLLMLGGRCVVCRGCMADEAMLL